MNEVSRPKARTTADLPIPNDPEAPAPDAPADADCSWGSCSAEPYWLEVAEALESVPDGMPGKPPS